MNATPQARHANMSGGIVGMVLIGILFTVFPLIMANAMSEDVPIARSRGWHLPWPLVQWALATPAVILALALACAVLILIANVMFLPRTLLAMRMGRALDVTDIPPELWPARPFHYDETRRERWLGRGRRTQLISLALLISAILLSLAVTGQADLHSSVT